MGVLVIIYAPPISCSERKQLIADCSFALFHQCRMNQQVVRKTPENARPLYRLLIKERHVMQSISVEQGKGWVCKGGGGSRRAWVGGRSSCHCVGADDMLEAVGGV